MHVFPAITSSAHPYTDRELPMTQADVDELVSKALQSALVALENSKPKMSHYPEPEQRHAQAIELVRRAIKESSV